MGEELNWKFDVIFAVTRSIFLSGERDDSKSEQSRDFVSFFIVKNRPHGISCRTPRVKRILAFPVNMASLKSCLEHRDFNATEPKLLSRFYSTEKRWRSFWNEQVFGTSSGVVKRLLKKCLHISFNFFLCLTLRKFEKIEHCNGIDGAEFSGPLRYL